MRGLCPLLGTLIVALGMFTPETVVAQPTRSRSSLLVFPRVVAQPERDTVIQLVNISNNNRRLRCAYFCADDETARCLPQGGDNVFDIFLTPHQPTHWVASRGRRFDPLDPECGFGGNGDCDGAGLDPGRVPPFRSASGALICLETDSSGFPVPGNATTGRATLESTRSFEVESYNALGLFSHDTNDMNETLCLGGPVRPGCPNGAEYDACPRYWEFAHLADRARDPVAGEGSTVETRITVSPCHADLSNLQEEAVQLYLLTTNEFGETFSHTALVPFWTPMVVSDFSTRLDRFALGSDHVRSRLEARSGDRLVGVIPLVEVVRYDAGTGQQTTTVSVVSPIGETEEGDILIMPGGVDQ